MSLKYNIAINLNAIIILLIILFHTLKNSERSFFQNKIFLSIINFTILLAIFDILARFDGNSHNIYPLINKVGNFMLFISIPIIPSLWLVYAHFQIFKDEKSIKKIISPIIAVNILNIIGVIVSQFNGCYYYIDGNNIYHRGDLYYFSNVINISLVVLSVLIIIFNKKKIEEEYFYSLLMFPLPPVLAILLQNKFYGLSLIISGLVIPYVLG